MRSAMGEQRSCRLCHGHDLSEALLLDRMPLSHHLRCHASEPDPRFSLRFEICKGCGLFQIVDPVPAALIYGEADTYTTGFQKPRHLDDLITTALACADPGRALDVGCNDGALMEALKRHGYGFVAGVEPNAAAAALAVKAGHMVYRDFLSPALAERIVAERGVFDVLYLRHVAEHIGELASFFAALRRLLGEGGLLVIELPEVEAGFARGNPAILWEEHVSYFTEPLAAYLLALYGFRILERRRYAFGGGSIAFVARKEGSADTPPTPPRPAAAIRLARRFVTGVGRYRRALRTTLKAARAAGYKVAIYGAAPRSAAVVGACKIGTALDLVIDDRSDIQGRLLPGTERPIRSLAEAATEVGGPLLCLLGVGAENEFKVRARMAAHLQAPPLCISLFPPRDTLASVAAVTAVIAGGVGTRGG